MNPTSTRLNYVIALTLICFITIFSSCSVLYKAAESATSGALDQLSTAQTDSLIRSWTNTATSELLSTINIDSLLNTVDSTLDESSRKLIENILSDYTAQQLEGQLRSIITGLQPDLISFRDELLGDETALLLANLRDQLINDSLTLRVGLIRDELLGPATGILLDTLIRSSLQTFVSEYTLTVKPALDSTFTDISGQAGLQVESTTQRIARILGWIVGAITVLVLGAILLRFFLLSRRYKNIVKVITSRIDSMPNQNAYDNLTKSINEVIKGSELDKPLQNVLEEVKEPTKEKWDDKDQQILALLIRHSGGVDNKVSLSQNLDIVKEEARELGLEQHLDSLLARNSK